MALILQSSSALGLRLQGVYGWAKITPFSFVGAAEELSFPSRELPFFLVLYLLLSLF